MRALQGAFDWLFGAASFIPHGVCLAWRPELVALHAGSDLLIALSYFVIPAALASFVSQRKDLTQGHQRVAYLFAAFITLCGLTHIGGLITLWQPYYGLQALLKVPTAIVSVVTAIALWPLLPKLVALPSPAVLKAEVEAHKRTMAELDAARRDLESQVAERTRELSIANRRFEAALAGSSVTVIEQDSDLRYTWIYNQPEDMVGTEFVGRTDSEAFGPVAAPIEAVKQAALRTGQPQRAEVPVEQPSGENLWFDLKSQPVELPDGRAGLISTAADITPQKRQQEHLALVMRELNHRSKNLLAVVQSVARQTAVGLDVPTAYMERLGARLQALAEAHDLLVEREWRGAELGDLVRRQLRHLVGEGSDRVRLTGAPVQLSPEQAPYVALALHELGANAAKYGALSNDGGRVDVDWSERAEPEGGRRLTLEWRESGGPTVTPPERRGFGRQILELLTPKAVGGEARLGFAPEGARWRLSMVTP
jgi:two-component sensor histidine kinase